ncbi:MAG TPA: ATP-binding protein [Sphingomicrobium sp.]|nr:ATP-binding protein [Sphingomicrobium sp.]
MFDDHQLAALGARRIATDTDPDDLVLPEEAGRRLGLIAHWLAQPPFIFREWGIHRFVDGGLRALFCGPSGTGKTMAAVALARSTERPLFRIDLGAVTSRYIGETEKNLQQLFEVADEAGAILLFDEADALLGKRSEVKDAHDRYANIEVSHLLRRIELFEGLAVVTTNLAGGIDEDAMSRIDVMVDFPMPDAVARETIWQKLLAAMKLPQGDDLDVPALASHELSGAEILRAVRVAASYAASEERKLDMTLLQAAAAERVKMRAGALTG